MQAHPADTISKLTDAINHGNLEEMMKYFDHEAVLVVRALGEQGWQVARGPKDIREAYAGFVSMKPTLRRITQHFIEAGNITLHFSLWSLSAKMPDGTTLDRKATSCDVLKKQPDGNWLVLLYNPYGADILGN